MIKILILYCKNLFSKFLRYFYWFLNLSFIKFGKLPKLTFPIKVEGKGEIVFGNYALIESNVNLKIAINAKLKAENNIHLENNSTILINSNCNLVIGNNFKLGKGSRIYVGNNWKFGDEIKIETNCAIFAREPECSGKLIIGNGTHIGDNTIIDLVNDIIIEDEVAIGPNCTLYTHDHLYTDKSKPAWKGGILSKNIKIHNGAWIGSNVTILPGVTIGSRTVVAAGSVVTKDLDTNCIYGGIPAKLIKKI